jgi:hypothetical protein
LAWDDAGSELYRRLTPLLRDLEAALALGS